MSGGWGLGRRLASATAVVTLLACLQFAPAALGQGTTPQLEKSFSPGQVSVGETTTLQFTITNPTASAQSWSFTDQLASGLRVDRSSPTANTCTGATVTAPLDGSTIQIGGQVAASGSCSVSMRLQAVETGTHVNAASNITQSNNIVPPTSPAQVECGDPAEPPIDDIVGVFVNCDFSDEPPANDFTIRQNWEASQGAVNYQTPVVGDLFGTGDPAIVVGTDRTITGGNPVTQRVARDLNVYDGATGNLLHNITTPRYSWSSFAAAAIADLDDDGRGEIIFRAASHSQTQADADAIGVPTAADVNGRLIAYKYNAADDEWDVMWVSDQRYDHGPNSASVQARGGGAVNIADFNGDGTPEVYVGNQVFNAVTGARLAAGPASASSGCQTPTDCLLAQTVAFDADDDGDLELAAGNVVYDVQISNPGGEAGNSIPITAQATGTTPVPRDGFTAVADMDLDGAPEVVVMAASPTSGGPILYVWDPQTEVVEGFRTGGTNGGTSGGPPMIGDIDGDGRPEIVVVFINRVRAYDFVPGTGLTNFWTLTTVDGSGGTSMSMFDFNNDGKKEIVYRDEQRIRIMDGGPSPASADRNLAAFQCGSGTSVDMPVIADIDGSGEARIAVTCGATNGAVQGRLRTYETDSFPWANTRPVWNQQAYFVTHINDDLTVPSEQFPNWTVFNDPDHRCSDGANRPLNAFQVQVTDLDSETGCPVVCVPPALEIDKTSDPPTGAILRPGDPITYTITIENTINDPVPDVDVTDDLSAVLDDATITSGPTVSPGAAGTAQINGGQLSFNGTIPGDGTVTISYEATVNAPDQLGDGELGNAVLGEFSNCDGVTGVLRCTTEHEVAALLLEKAADRATANVGDEIEYTFTLTNTGAVPLTGVAVNDPLPGLSAPVCQQANLAPDASTTCTATKTATVADAAAGQIVNTATATGNDPGNRQITSNQASDTVLVAARSDLELEKTATALVDPGQQVTWTLRVTNNGPEDSSGSTVTDILPPGITNIQTSTPGCTVQGSTVTCAVGPLAWGAFKDIVITGNAPQTPATCFENDASVQAAESDPNLENDEDSARTCTTPAADLELTKTGPATVDPSEPAAYQLRLTNNGPNDSPGAVVTDEVPAEVTIGTVPQNCTVQGQTVTCSFGPIPSGQFRDIEITGTATDEPSTCFENTAAVEGVQGSPADQVEENDTPTARTCTTPASDLELTKTAAESAEPGGQVTWTLRVTNKGPNSSPGASVTDLVPPGVTNVASSTPGCTVQGNAVTCDVGELDADEFTEIVITGDAPQRSGICFENAASLEGEQVDPKLENDTASARTCVPPASDLSIAKSAPTNVEPGATITWAIVVRNDGPNDSAGAAVVDSIPPGITNVATPTPGCEVVSGEVRCTVGALANGASTEITVTGTAPANPSTCVENSATVTGEAADPDLSDNAGSVRSCTRAPIHDLSLIKTASRQKVTVGEAFTYTLIAKNNGPDTAPDVIVRDMVPSQFDVVEATSDQGTCTVTGNQVECAVGTLANGEAATVTVKVVAARVGEATNTAVVEPPDPTGGNNDDGVKVQVVRPKLRLSKRVNHRRIEAGDTATYAIEIRNVSAVAVRNVRVCDNLPAGLVLVRATPNAKLSSGAYCWTIKRLAARGSKTMRLTTRALPGARGRIVNTATARLGRTRVARARRGLRVQGGGPRGGGVTG